LVCAHSVFDAFFIPADLLGDAPGRVPLPAEWNIPLMAPVIFIFFFIGAAGEELGYIGYAIDPLQERWGALTACLIVGPCGPYGIFRR